MARTPSKKTTKHIHAQEFGDGVSVTEFENTETIEQGGGELDLAAALADPAATEVSEEFVGRWHDLISTTNWEKGRIILEWRQALISTEAPVTCYSDEAWAQRVGGVTSQHVGRLRRVYERFGASFTTYARLYWSHFLACLEWDDAEMWLEGAVQSKWSISEMRGARAEALGLSAEAVQSELDVDAVIQRDQQDEDFEPLEEIGQRDGMETDVEAEDRVGTTGPTNEGPDFGDEEEREGLDRNDSTDDGDIPFEPTSPKSWDNPFASLPQVPADVAEAMELFKLAIVRHRAGQWDEVSRAEVLQVLDALRTFASHDAP